VISKKAEIKKKKNTTKNKKYNN